MKLELVTQNLALTPFAPIDVDELLSLFQDVEVRRFLLDGYEVCLVLGRWDESE